MTRDPMGALLHGMRVTSVANVDNLQLLARERFERRVDEARPETMAALCAALATAVDCR